MEVLVYRNNGIVIRFEIVGDEVVVVYELIPGEELYPCLRVCGGRPPSPTFNFVILTTAFFLWYLVHDWGIVHGDVLTLRSDL